MMMMTMMNFSRLIHYILTSTIHAARIHARFKYLTYSNTYRYAHYDHSTTNSLLCLEGDVTSVGQNLYPGTWLCYSSLTCNAPNLLPLTCIIETEYWQGKRDNSTTCHHAQTTAGSVTVCCNILIDRSTDWSLDCCMQTISHLLLGRLCIVEKYDLPMCRG